MNTTRQQKKIAPPGPATIAALFAHFRDGNPHPSTELEFQSPFQLLIAVILSAQTTDRAVNLATRPLFSRAPDARSLLAIGEVDLTDAIKTIGLYKTKARHVIATCRQLLDQHGGQVPSRREQLEALPGVGRKTANVVLNTAFGQPTMAVDTHIFRVANRLGLSHGKTPLAVENDLLKCIPHEFMNDAHHWLLLHGRYICKARKPECWRCPVPDLCPFPDKHLSPDQAAPLELTPPQKTDTSRQPFPRRRSKEKT